MTRDIKEGRHRKEDMASKIPQPVRRALLTLKLYQRMIANPDERIPFVLTDPAGRQPSGYREAAA